MIKIEGQINILIIVSPEEEKDETNDKELGYGQGCKAEYKAAAVSV